MNEVTYTNTLKCYKAPRTAVDSRLPLSWSKKCFPRKEREVSQPCWVQVRMGTREGVVFGEGGNHDVFAVEGRFLSTGSARNHRQQMLALHLWTRG